MAFSMVERNPEISVVVPLLGEQDNIGPLRERSRMVDLREY
jgi:hypothetical protein